MEVIIFSSVVVQDHGGPWINRRENETPLNKSVTTDSFEENEDHAEF